MLFACLCQLFFNLLIGLKGKIELSYRISGNFCLATAKRQAILTQLRFQTSESD